MSVKIRDIRVICTAPEGINLVVVKIETNQPGLYGLGCATFAYRHLTVKHLIEEYMKPLLVGRPVENIEETWQLMHQNGYWRNGPIENNAISGIDMALFPGSFPPAGGNELEAVHADQLVPAVPGQFGEMRIDVLDIPDGVGDDDGDRRVLHRRPQQP